MQVKVVYKRPTDLALKADVPVVCNLLLADIMDEGAPALPASVVQLLPVTLRQSKSASDDI